MPGCRPESGSLPLPPVRRTEIIARAFHASYEQHAPSWGGEGSSKAWDDISASNRELMMEVVADLLDQGVIR